jgi:hypothetical protein
MEDQELMENHFDYYGVTRSQQRDVAARPQSDFLISRCEVWFGWGKGGGI